MTPPRNGVDRKVMADLISDRDAGSLVATVALALHLVPWPARQDTARAALEALHSDGWEITRTRVERYDPEETW